jgi:hypothetical protein
VPKLRYIRAGDRLADGSQLVVRGGPLGPDVVRRDACRMHSIYVIYGISVFAVREVSLDELAQRTPLVRFALLTLMSVGALQRAGTRIQPTGRNPHRFTVAFDDLDPGVLALCAVEHTSWHNPYHVD